jgi:hypothetical protein
MTNTKKPFLPITNDIDDMVIERMAQAKGVPTLSVGAESERPRNIARREPADVPQAAMSAGWESAEKGRGDALVPAAVAADMADVARSEPSSGPNARARVTYVRAGIPDYAHKELALRQIHENVTLNYLILQGLRAIGITIAEADMVEDGRRLRGRRA